MSDLQYGRRSLDGRHWWDGQQWQPMQAPPPPPRRSLNDDSNQWTLIAIGLGVLILLGLGVASLSHNTSTSTSPTADTAPVATTPAAPASPAGPTPKQQEQNWHGAFDPKLADFVTANKDAATACGEGSPDACKASLSPVLSAAQALAATLRATPAPACIQVAVGKLVVAADLIVTGMTQEVANFRVGAGAVAAFKDGAVLVTQGGGPDRCPAAGPRTL
jgi:hypothetical protein